MYLNIQKVIHIRQNTGHFPNVYCFMAINKCLYPYDGIQFSNKEGKSADVYNNIGKVLKHYAKENNPDTNGYLLFYSI